MGKTQKNDNADFAKVLSFLKSKKENNFKEDKYKIGIVGVGAVGTVFAVLLCNAGYDVEVTKKTTNDLVVDNRINLEVTGAFGNYSYLVPNVQNNNFTTKKDMIIMCTKSNSTVFALNEVKKHLKPDGIVVTIENVITYNEILKIISAHQYVPMVIDFSSTRLRLNEVKVTVPGLIHVGTMDSKVDVSKVKKIFDNVTETVVEKDIKSFIVSKFILDCSLSSIVAITGHRVGVTFLNNTARNLLIGLISEMMEVFISYGLTITSFDDDLNYYKFTQKGLKGNLYRRKMFRRLIKQNCDNGSALLYDLENNLKTELNGMCAKVCEMADAKGIETPFNRQVAEFLARAEQHKEGLNMYNLNRPEFTELKIKWR